MALRLIRDEITACRGEIRVHFHVPLYFSGSGVLGSTAALLTERFWRMLVRHRVPHLEIETYTFDVLPRSLRKIPVTQSVAREYDWVLARLTPVLPSRAP